jgi:hypothetical protein
VTAYWPVLAYVALVCLATATVTGSLNPVNRTRKANFDGNR